MIDTDLEPPYKQGVYIDIFFDFNKYWNIKFFEDNNFTPLYLLELILIQHEMDSSIIWIQAWVDYNTSDMILQLIEVLQTLTTLCKLGQSCLTLIHVVKLQTQVLLLEINTTLK